MRIRLIITTYSIPQEFFEALKCYGLEIQTLSSGIGWEYVIHLNGDITEQKYDNFLSLVSNIKHVRLAFSNKID